MKEIKIRSACPISSALDIFGDKWSMLIIRDMVFDRKNTYGDFLKSDEKIATNILADRLLLLESAGIILKKGHPDSKAKNMYVLTERGKDLIPVLLEIVVWSEKYGNYSQQVQMVAKMTKENREMFVNNLREGL